MCILIGFNQAWRPFCSERCKLIDLGDWAAERHVIGGAPVEENGSDNEPDVDSRRQH